MIAICNGTDLTDYVAQGYAIEMEPQYGTSLTALNGLDYTAKIRDRVKLTVPVIPVTLTKLTEILQLFPDNGAYVNWTFYDPVLAAQRTMQAKYDTRGSALRVAYVNGNEYYSGLVIKLTER